MQAMQLEQVERRHSSERMSAIMHAKLDGMLASVQTEGHHFAHQFADPEPEAELLSIPRREQDMAASPQTPPMQGCMQGQTGGTIGAEDNGAGLSDEGPSQN